MQVSCCRNRRCPRQRLLPAAIYVKILIRIPILVVISSLSAAATARAPVRVISLGAHKYELATDDAVVTLADGQLPTARAPAVTCVRVRACAHRTNPIRVPGRNSITQPRWTRLRRVYVQSNRRQSRRRWFHQHYNSTPVRLQFDNATTIRRHMS